MASLKLAAALLLAGIALVNAQDIVDNPAPKAGDICKDRGDQWKNITLGPCEAGTECRTIKRGVYKCVPKDARGNMPIGALCYNTTKVDKAKTRAEGEKWRTYYRQRSCLWEGTDKQGTPVVQCVQTKDPAIYRCARVPKLGTDNVFTVAGSMIWGRWNDDQAYDACNGCPCTPKGKKCRIMPCKYPECPAGPCSGYRKTWKCATS